jgi:hypothetical protein
MKTYTPVCIYVDEFHIKYFGKKGRNEGRKERERNRRRAIYIFRREQRKDRCP